MLSLREYRNRADRLADHLPWAALVAPGVVLNKDGSFQRTARFRGPDLESATEAELIAACARANNVLKRFGSGWALHFEAERREALGYPPGTFPEAASWLVDQERYAAFSADGARCKMCYDLYYFMHRSDALDLLTLASMLHRRAQRSGRLVFCPVHHRQTSHCSQSHPCF